MTQSDLHALYSHPQRQYPSILSVYLNVDQSQPSNRNHGFEQQLKTVIESLRAPIHDPAELERFATAAHHIEDFVRAYEPTARGLTLFFDAVDGFFWHQEVGVALHNQVRWNHELFLQPLANVLDQFERYGVVLVDAHSLRLFAIVLGEIEEVRLERFGPNAHLRRVRNGHLRAVMKEVDWFVQRQHVHRLVLAGDSDMTSRLRDRLPKRLALLIIGTVNIPVDTAAFDVLMATRNLDEQYERSTEIQTVKEVLRGVAGNERTAAGLGRTLKAVNADRVWELIYSQGLSVPGYECGKCAALFSRVRTTCSYCGGSVRPVNNVVELAVDHAVRQGAKIEVVTGEACAALNEVGGIAAFLKGRG